MSSAAGFRLSGNYSNAEFFPDLDTAQRIARTHAMLVLSQGWQLGFDGPTWDGTVEDTFLDEMKAANPGLKIYRYLNAIYDPNPHFPESWYMHDRHGHRLFNTMWRNYLMDPRSTAPFVEKGVTSNGWVEYLANLFRRDDARFPGVFNGGVWLDDVGGTPHVVDIVTGQPAQAVRSGSGELWDTRAWYELTLGAASRLQKYVGRGMFANALMSSNCYFSGCGGPVPTREFLSSANALDGSMAEAWLRAWYDPFPRFPSVAAWKQNVQLLIDADRHGRAIQVMTAIPAGASTEQLDQWRLYSFASFLLGNEGSSYFQFVPYGQSKNSFEMANPLYSVDIGAPLKHARSIGAYARAGGRFFVRNYAGGKVFVNPNSTAVVVRLDKPYAFPDGTHTQKVVLQPYSGAILVGKPGNAQASKPKAKPAHKGSGQHRGRAHRRGHSGWRLVSRTP
jgi:hypothetical protein